MGLTPKQLVVLGDSGVHGWGDRDGGGWCQRLRLEWMNLPEAPVIYELGVRGDGLERVAQRWDAEWSCRGELRRKHPDGLLLCVGLNDTARVGRVDGRSQLSLEAYAFGMTRLLEEIKEKTPVMVLGLTPVDEAVMPFADCLWYSNRDVELYEAALEEVCLEMNVPFLAVHDAFRREPDWLSWMEPDGIHLNADGHRWMQQRLRTWAALLTWAQLTPVANVCIR